MNILSKLKKSKNDKQNQMDSLSPQEGVNKYDLIQMNNYMLADVKKEILENNCYTMTLSEISEISPIAINSVNNIKEIVNKSKNSNKLYCITNIGKNDSLKAMKDGKTFWGAIQKNDGSSKMAKLKEVNPNEIMQLNPTIMMMSFVLSSIEVELKEIKKITQKILLFLEQEKESEIESDLEILNRSINDFKYNLTDEKYLLNNHKQVLDIKRTANKNMLFYKKQISEELSKDVIFTTNSGMTTNINNLAKQFKYYRLSLYIYSFATLMEILLLGNYQTDFLVLKQKELNELDIEYSNTFKSALNYVKNNGNKILEGNILSSLGTAGKAIGTLAEKVKVKNIDTWLNEKSENLKQSSQNIKDNFISKFKEIEDSNSQGFIKQIEKVDYIYNKTKQIYFDKENVYLQIK